MRALIILVLAAVIFGAAGYSTWYLFIKPQEDLKMEKAQPPPPPPPDPTVPDFNKIVETQKRGDLASARAGFTDFVERYPESTKLDEAKYRLGEINTKLFLSPAVTPDKETYFVKSGDVITKVAARTKNPPELLMRMNNLDNIMLRIGQKLVYSPVDFSMNIDRQTKHVVLLNHGKFFKQYSIRVMPVHAAAGGAQKTTKATPTPAKLPKVTGRVTEKVSWLNGSRVTFSDKGFANADHWIVIQPAGNSLYTDREVGPNEPKPQKPPGGGFGLAAEPMQELAAMVAKNTPVTIE